MESYVWEQCLTNKKAPATIERFQSIWHLLCDCITMCVIWTSKNVRIFDNISDTQTHGNYHVDCIP